MIEDIVAQAHGIVDTLAFRDGLVALSALRAIDRTPPQAGPFAHLLGIEFLEMGQGRCRARLEVSHHLLNPHGIAHGGVAFSLADSTCGGAAISAVGGPRIVTQDMQIRYHGPARRGTIEALAEVLHHGNRTVTVSGRIIQEDILIASVTATFAILTDQELRLIREKIDEGTQASLEDPS